MFDVLSKMLNFYLLAVTCYAESSPKKKRERERELFMLSRRFRPFIRLVRMLHHFLDVFSAFSFIFLRMTTTPTTEKNECVTLLSGC